VKSSGTAWLDNPMRLNAIKLELERLDQLIRPFFAKALEGCTASASVMVRLSQRRSELLGLDAPLRIDATLIEVREAPTSTEKWQAAIDQLVGKPAPSEQSH
jgi:hypothetical protein